MSRTTSILVTTAPEIWRLRLFDTRLWTKKNPKGDDSALICIYIYIYINRYMVCFSTLTLLTTAHWSTRICLELQSREAVTFLHHSTSGHVSPKHLHWMGFTGLMEKFYHMACRSHPVHQSHNTEYWHLTAVTNQDTLFTQWDRRFEFFRCDAMSTSK